MFIYPWRRSPESKSMSLSSPFFLPSTSLGNFVLIISQSLKLTKVFDFPAVRSQEPTLVLQRGQFRLLCSTVPFKQRKQRLCSQGSVTGSIKIPLHTGHNKSLKFTCEELLHNEGSNNFDVLFKQVAIFLCSLTITRNVRLNANTSRSVRPCTVSRTEWRQFEVISQYGKDTKHGLLLF